MLLHPWSISVTSNLPRRAFDARLGSSPSLVHRHHLKFAQTSVRCSSGCFSIPRSSPSPQIHPDERLTLVWVLLHPWSISVTSNLPRRVFDARLGASPSLVHLHNLKFTQTSDECSSGCLFIPSPSPSLVHLHLHHFKSTQTSGKHSSGCFSIHSPSLYLS